MRECGNQITSNIRPAVNLYSIRIPRPKLKTKGWFIRKFFSQDTVNLSKYEILVTISILGTCPFLGLLAEKSHRFYLTFEIEQPYFEIARRFRSKVT